MLLEYKSVTNVPQQGRDYEKGDLQHMTQAETSEFQALSASMLNNRKPNGPFLKAEWTSLNESFRRGRIGRRPKRLEIIVNVSDQFSVIINIFIRT
jgi:hypothetical protein